MQYFGADGLGSVRQIIDASAAVVGSSRYDPYGNVMSQGGSATSVFAFAGEQQDATGLEYLRARYYSSAQGRFTTRDVWEGDANLPMSYNAWGYSYDDPVDLSDPTGMDAPWCDRAPDPIACKRDYTRSSWYSQDPLFSDWRNDKRASQLGLKSPFETHSNSATAWAVVQDQNQYNARIRERVAWYFYGENQNEDQVARWVKRIIGHESAFDPNAVGPTGDLGLMQLTDPAYQDVINDIGGTPTPMPGITATRAGYLLNPNINIDFGVHYLKILWRRFKDQDARKGWQVDDIETWRLVFGAYKGSGIIYNLREDFWTQHGGKPTPTVTATLRRGTPTRTPLPTPCPTLAIPPAYWRDISGGAPSGRQAYINAVMGDWSDNPIVH